MLEGLRNLLSLPPLQLFMYMVVILVFLFGILFVISLFFPEIISPPDLEVLQNFTDILKEWAGIEKSMQ